MSQTGDERQGDVWQHGHLQQENEGFANVLEKTNCLAKEKPCRQAEDEPHDDLRAGAKSKSALTRHHISP